MHAKSVRFLTRPGNVVGVISKRCRERAHPPVFNAVAFMAVRRPDLSPRLVNRLCVQFLQQRLGVLQISGVEALGEPVVDFGEHAARLVAAILLREQARREARRDTQLLR
jgi:hypothetical protein